MAVMSYLTQRILIQEKCVIYGSNEHTSSDDVTIHQTRNLFYRSSGRYEPFYFTIYIVGQWKFNEDLVFWGLIYCFSQDTFLGTEQSVCDRDSLPGGAFKCIICALDTVGNTKTQQSGPAIAKIKLFIVK